MKLRFYIKDNGYEPKKAHSTDAGYDLRCCESFCLKARQSYTCDTNVVVIIPEGYVGFIKSKSGLNFKHDIISEGVIDCGYTGSIKVRLHNLSDEDYNFEEGDKITQLVVFPVLSDEEVETLVMPFALERTDRGSNGFGSTGK